MGNRLNLFIRQIVIITISVYQRLLSPIKGFSCAYRINYNSESCSCYVKRVFLEQDTYTALALSRKRFRDCSKANRVLISKQNNIKNSQSYLDRRKVLHFLSLFSLSFFTLGAGGGCPGVNACCSSTSEDNDDSNKDN